MQSRLRMLLLPALCLMLIACACSRRPTSTADVPRVISPSYVISVAPFTQPINASQLITGRIPDNQGRIADEQLPSLDRRFRNVLTTDSKRQFKYIDTIDLPRDLTRFHSSEQPQALPLWIAYGKKQGAQLLYERIQRRVVLAPLFCLGGNCRLGSLGLLPFFPEQPCGQQQKPQKQQHTPEKRAAIPGQDNRSSRRGTFGRRGA